VLRLVFWQASADAGWPGSAAYKGDAWVWLEWARALDTGQTFELGIPIRPPAAAWVLAAVWNGTLSGLRWATLWWTVLGALGVALFHGAARRVAGEAVGLVTGVLCAASSGLMILSTSLNNETPYLVVLGGVLWLAACWEEAPRPGGLLVFGALNALACLVRVEHALFFGPAALWLAWRWSTGLSREGLGREGLGRQGLRRLAWIGAGFVVTLLPWQLTIWERIGSFNRGPVPEDVATDRSLTAQERAVAHLEWEPDALAARDAVPAFVRRPVAAFVGATVAHRGGARVSAEDFEVVEEAFGYTPRPLTARPFVVATGGLNFALANHPASSGGFDPQPLAEPPPLRGGAAAYPAAMISGLPPGDLAFTYPGHLRLVNEGYRVGLGWMASDPRAALELLGHKLAISWRGAALGFGGWNLPLGAGGLRRPVDLATPEGAWPAVWRWLVLLAAAWGALRAWRRPAARLWLGFLASKLVVVLAFYGYARQGATAFPAIAFCLACGVEPWLARLGERALWRGALAAAAILLALEGARWAARPEIVIDGRTAGAHDALPPGDHDAHSISWR
jgi:hypothetical protein